MSFIIRNISGGTVSVDDLGIEIPVGGEYDLRQEQTNDIQQSEDLRTRILASELIVVDPLAVGGSPSPALTQLQSLLALDVIPNYRIFGGDLNQLDDVNIGSPITGNVLRYTGSGTWTDGNLSFSDLAGSPGFLTTDELVKVSSNDTTSDYLINKLVAGSPGIAIIEVNDGGNETLRIVNTFTDTGITELTGDVTAGPGSGSQAATIANDAVTNIKLANMAQATIKGRAAASGTGDPVDLTAAQVRTIINVEDNAAADQNLFETVTGDTGSTTANTTTDTLTIAGGTGISTAVAGDTLTITNDDPNVDQNVFTDFSADTGSVTAGSTTAALVFAGGGDIFTEIAGSPQTLTIEIGRSIVLRQNAGLTQTFNTTSTTVLFNTDIRTDSEFSYSAGQVTVNNAGWYEIIYEVSVEHTTSTGFFSTATATAQSSIYINGVESTGTRSYAWFHGAAPAGSTMTGRAVLNLSASDTVEVQVVRSGGTNLGLQTIAQGCRLLIQSTDAP